MNPTKKYQINIQELFTLNLNKLVKNLIKIALAVLKMGEPKLDNNPSLTRAVLLSHRSIVSTVLNN